MAFDISEKYIAEAEKILHCSLPSSYKSIMRDNNGGTVEIDGEFWELFPIRDSSNKKRLARSCNDIITETNSYSKYTNFPENSLAIASDGSGNLLIFMRRSSNAFCVFSEEVYILDHETGSITKISDSFKDLQIE